MTSAKNFLITAAMTVGLTAAGAGTAFADTPTAAQATPSMAVAQPSWNNDNWNNDNNNDNGRGRGNWDRNNNNGRGSWDHNDGWRFNRRIFAVSPWQCRWGNGHINWHDGKCWGGRFSGARLRWW
jgi:hypothetical protein